MATDISTIPVEQLKLMQTDAFSEILTKDKVLDELEAKRFNPRDEFFALMATFGKRFSISGVVINPITPAVWSLLFFLKSPYLTKGEITELDNDIFLYLLHNGLNEINSISEIPIKALGFSKKHGLNYEETVRDLKEQIYIAFRPLEMLDGGDSDIKPRFDADWLTRLVSIVASQTNFDANYIKYNLSLTECYYYFIQYLRKLNPSSEIYRRSDEEICEEMLDRTYELGAKFYQDYLSKEANKED